MIFIKKLLNSPISSNCFVIFDKVIGNDCIIIDPGSENNKVLYNYLDFEMLTPSYVILTHEHFDHCWGVNQLRDRYPKIKLVCTRICSDAIQDKKKNYSVYNKQPGFEVAPADIIIDEVNWTLFWGRYRLRFEPAQGHSAAGIILFIDKYVFTGDTLIKDIKTVIKLKTASKERLLESISLLEKEKGNHFIVCSGHGVLFELDGYDLKKAFQ